ncbi:MAG: SDR family NAD(P)-dependent oxidoreductase [Chloroflexota bacterium]|nr:SDR family NAD(P)-dependent oxidoreductase [Chloroflexota bacterium]
MKPTTLEGQVALVTGGGGGIGSAICRRLASEGAQVIITYRSDEAKALAVAASLAGGDHLALHAPVDDGEALGRLAGTVQARYGQLDILVNNAGITEAVPHEDLDGLDDALIDRIFRVNWRGAFASIRALKALLMAGDGGVVINISSIAGRTGVGSNVAYCASKAAMDSMTRSLARALAPQIRVLSVSPGWVNGEYAQRMPRALLAEQEAKTPLARIAEAEDVAEAVYVAIAHLRFSTGDIIPVDGGRPLG